MWESEFRSKAKTGDLLIFRGHECTAKCQRCLTGAHYDHVALLLRINDFLQVYETTSKDGCMMRSWREFLVNCWNLYYDKMVYRELIIDAQGEEKEKIQKELQANAELFHKETTRKNYTLNCCNIICTKKKAYEENNEWGKSDGFFCSQLVAAAYLRCGILTYDKGTGFYLPGSFSQSHKNMILQKPYSLGPEVILEFTQ